MSALGDELASFRSPPIIINPNSTTQDLPNTPAADLPRNTPHSRIDGPRFTWQPIPGSPQFAGSPAGAPGDYMLPCGTSPQRTYIEQRLMQLCDDKAQRRHQAFLSVFQRELKALAPGIVTGFEYFLKRYMHMPAQVELISTDKPVSIVGFTGGPDSKGNKPHQARWSWKEQSMQGMRAVADPSIQQPGSPYYVGLKKTLELENDGNGNKWRAHEYTPLLPAHDDPTKLLPWVNSLRIVYKVDEPPSSNSSKRHRADDSNGPSNNGHRVSSDVWKHMTRVHVQAPTDDNAPGGSSNKKNNPYKLMYAICHHCDKVFNADPKNGTNNQSKHLANCKCDCPPATVAQGDGSHKEQDNTSAGPGCSSSWETPSSVGFPTGVAYPLIPSLPTETRGEFLVPVGYTNQN